MVQLLGNTDVFIAIVTFDFVEAHSTAQSRGEGQKVKGGLASRWRKMQTVLVDDAKETRLLVAFARALSVAVQSNSRTPKVDGSLEAKPGQLMGPLDG